MQICPLSMFVAYYSATTPATRQNFPQIKQIKMAEVDNSFPTNYACNQAVNYTDNRFLIILDNLLESYC